MKFFNIIPNLIVVINLLNRYYGKFLVLETSIGRVLEARFGYGSLESRSDSSHQVVSF